MMSKYDIEVYRLENKAYSTLKVFGSTLGKFILFAGLTVTVSLVLAPLVAAGVAAEGVVVGVNVARGA